ncbi:MAG: hypothetical protein R3280_07085 [Marinobacter sp.]|uniref:hypothetical protein n=1 Tax=Marinobacter sp. TaxID=50741 RepID=UPI00299D2868|nr:hypothetical protein [Marinobacter sp.]MDX1634380.1 hypothetical protein [Marinobacter sp.]
MVWLKAFVSGFLATLIFHQGLFAVFHYAGMVPSAPFNMAPVPPLGVPQVISLAFFGGLWGIVLWAIIGRFAKAAFWALAVILGAVGPTVVAMLVVFPLKGMDVNAQMWVGGLILNAFWGLGLAVFLALMGARRGAGAR